MNVKKLSHHMAGWQLLTKNIPCHKAENRVFARELYNHKPHLPSLKDELRKGGLV